jgi:hypothetical protein
MNPLPPRRRSALGVASHRATSRAAPLGRPGAREERGVHVAGQLLPTGEFPQDHLADPWDRVSATVPAVSIHLSTRADPSSGLPRNPPLEAISLDGEPVLLALDGHQQRIAFGRPGSLNGSPRRVDRERPIVSKFPGLLRSGLPFRAAAVGPRYRAAPSPACADDKREGQQTRPQSPRSPSHDPTPLPGDPESIRGSLPAPEVQPERGTGGRGASKTRFPCFSPGVSTRAIDPERRDTFGRK